MNVACPYCKKTVSVGAAGLYDCPLCNARFQIDAGATPSAAPPATTPPVGGTTCPRHPAESATFLCARCGDFLCGLCARSINGKPYCPLCGPRVGAEGVPDGTVWSIGSVFSRSAELAAGTIGPAFLLNLPLSILNYILLWWMGIAGQGLPQQMRPGGGVFSRINPVAAIVCAVLFVPFVWASLRVQAATFSVFRHWLFERRPQKLGEALASGDGLPAPLFGTFFLAGLAIVPLYLVLLLPILVTSATNNPVFMIGFVIAVPLVFVAMAVLATRWSMLLPVAIYERVFYLSAFTRSAKLVQGQGWNVLILFFLVFVVFGVLSVLTAVVTGLLSIFVPFFPGLVQQLVQLALTIYLLATLASTYYGLRSLERAA
jgi:hypothetical protein